jgi:DNA-binding transcriptional LysR family regulator
MELHQLRCFQAVVEEGGFKRATSRLHMTQPALSYQMKQLEQELDAILFHRRPGGVSLTEAGRVLFEHVQAITETIRRAENAVRELTEGVVGEIRVGTVNSVGIYFLPQVLRSVRTSYPIVRTQVLCRRDSNVILEALRQNRLDLAIVANPKPDRQLSYETILEEQISLLSGPAFPFHGEATVKASQLEGVPFVSISQDLPTGQTIHEYLELLGVHVDSVISTDNVETARKMVEAGLGVALLPDMFITEDVPMLVPSKGLWRSTLDPPLSRRLVLATWKHHQLGQAGVAFIRELRRYACEWKSCMDSEAESPCAVPSPDHGAPIRDLPNSLAREAAQPAVVERPKKKSRR